MRTPGRTRRATRILGSGLLIGALTMGLAATSSATAEEPEATPTPSAVPTAPAESEPSVQAEEAAPPVAEANPPFGTTFPIVQETNFARPVRALSSDAYSDFSQLDDLERLIRGSYQYPSNYPVSSLANKLRPESERTGNRVDMSMSRMEDSKRVGRELLRAARVGVKVRFVHGKDSQSSASRSLQSQLNAAKYKGNRTGFLLHLRQGQEPGLLVDRQGRHHPHEVAAGGDHVHARGR